MNGYQARRAVLSARAAPAEDRGSSDRRTVADGALSEGLRYLENEEERATNSSPRSRCPRSPGMSGQHFSRSLPRVPGRGMEGDR